jgi:hypothetical protein
MLLIPLTPLTLPFTYEAGAGPLSDLYNALPLWRALLFDSACRDLRVGTPCCCSSKAEDDEVKHWPELVGRGARDVVKRLTCSLLMLRLAWRGECGGLVVPRLEAGPLSSLLSGDCGLQTPRLLGV